MRRCYLVCYDISNQKRWRKVFRVMNGFGEHWQYSVFFCVLREMDRVTMEMELRAAMKMTEDQAIIVDLGGDEGAAREAAVVIGQSLPAGMQSGTVVM